MNDMMWGIWHENKWLTIGKASETLYTLVGIKFLQHGLIVSILGSRRSQLVYAQMLITSCQYQREDSTDLLYHLSSAIQQTKCLGSILPTMLLQVLLCEPKFSLGSLYGCCDTISFTGFAGLGRGPTSEHIHNVSLLVAQNCVGCSSQHVRCFKYIRRCNRKCTSCPT